MPIYEYRCSNGHTFELFHRMSDPAPDACEVCGAKELEKILFPVAVHYKGSGFYSTDYGKGRKPASKDGGDSGSSEKKESSSGDGGSSSGSTASSTEKSSGSGSSGTSSGSGSSGSSSD